MQAALKCRALRGRGWRRSARSSRTSHGGGVRGRVCPEQGWVMKNLSAPAGSPRWANEGERPGVSPPVVTPACRDLPANLRPAARPDGHAGDHDAAAGSAGTAVLRRRMRSPYLLPQDDAVDHLQERQGAGLDDVGADGPAAQRSCPCTPPRRWPRPGRPRRPSRCGRGSRCSVTSMPVMRSMALNTASTGPSPMAGVADDGAVLVPQADGGRRDRAGAGVAGDRLERPQRRAGVDLRLGQRLDVGVVDLLLAVGQHLEVVEHLLQLLVVEVVAQVAGRAAAGRAGRCACPAPVRSAASRRPRAA